MGLSQKQLALMLFSLLGLGVTMTTLIFFGSRMDPSMRVAAQTAAITMGGQLITILSTMLTGKDLVNSDKASQPQQVPNAPPTPPTIPSA